MIGLECPEVPSIIEVWDPGVIGIAFALPDSGINLREFLAEIAR